MQAACQTKAILICTFVTTKYSTLGCSIPNTLVEFGLIWPRTGCLLTPFASIQNPGSSKQEEVCPWVVQTFQLWKKNRVPGMGGKCCEKKQSPHFLWTLFFSSSGKKQSPRKVRTLFFFIAFLPYVWDSVFLGLNVQTTLGQTSWKLKEISGG